MKNIVIVESPSKAKTIEKYLGRDFSVLATYGHIRDLPEKKLGIDIDNRFLPEYVIPKKSQKTIASLKASAKKADMVYLATDPDREGEAISWHVAEALSLKKFKRIEFFEITKEAVTTAVKHPREINHSLVDAQQARRVLDRLVGYKLSPLLWRKVRKGLSAGRVQSIATKLIVDREREIEAHRPEEYWLIDFLFETTNNEKFTASVTKYKNKAIKITTATEAKKIDEAIPNGQYNCHLVTEREVKRQPYAPFTTSTLQQDASRKLYFSAKKTMMVAQQLYEGVDIGEKSPKGLITYMRTDSKRLSAEAIAEGGAVIKKKFGDKYLFNGKRDFQKSKQAQEAHEAIRPTSFSANPNLLEQYLSPDQFRLYKLIYERALSSLMTPAIYRQKSVDFLINDYTIHAGGRTLVFDGFLALYKTGDNDQDVQALPDLKTGDSCRLYDRLKAQKFTEPPARYSEASLVKALEEQGIGRPSTYAPTISTIQDRNYVVLEERRFKPTEIAYVVNDLLVDNFPDVINVNFTAKIELEFDDIAKGNIVWPKVVSDFWQPFEKDLEKALKEVEKIKLEKETDITCDLCGSKMVIRYGRFGEFIACSNFPECKNTKPLIPEGMDIDCPKCKEGKVIAKRTKKRRTFWGCSRYPDCDYASWVKPKK